jgi:hypothetical protein
MAVGRYIEEWLESTTAATLTRGQARTLLEPDMAYGLIVVPATVPRDRHVGTP